MAILGVIIFLAGGLSMVYGIVTNNSHEAQARALFEHGQSNPGTLFIVIGTLAVVLGLVLIIIGAMKRKI